ncbi:serine/threonine protein kinase [Actinokineospora auranticolor]|uniref:non-specific serine/threonine protein kinase n=1 Tax=Actinokineospora auranticolor TaxID=155976 RepID=A0A2S6GFN8_9PSEU|nr:serine/threonine protein kinase [Actinokineospora auranticolor]
METGTLLDDRYRLEELIGSGGMADVHSAVDTRLGRRVAIKQFHPRADGATVARLESEARLLAGLSHPGLVRVYDVAVDNDHPYLVMQLVEGGTLRHRLNDGVLPAGETARIGVRLAAILGYVHSRGIVHRDVKPSNVLMDSSTDGQPADCYLADFGIARALDGARLTSTGHCVGTAAYLSPEQVKGDPTGPPADIYSLGLVLLECLTGTAAFEGAAIETALARLSRDPEVPSWLPAVWANTLTAMTARNPDERPDATECGHLLATAALLGPLASPEPKPKPDEADDPRPGTAELPVRGRSPGLVHASLMAGALLVGGTAALLSTGASAAEQPATEPAAHVVVSTPQTTSPPLTAAPLPVRAATGVIEVPTVQTKVITVTRQAPVTRERPRWGGGGWGGWGGGWGNDWGPGDDGG